MSRKPKPKIVAKAVLAHPGCPCSDGVHRDVWKAVVEIGCRQGARKTLRPTFFSKAAALAHAGTARDTMVAAGGFPETMRERQRRENAAERAVESDWLGTRRWNDENPIGEPWNI